MHHSRSLFTVFVHVAAAVGVVTGTTGTATGVTASGVASVPTEWVVDRVRFEPVATPASPFSVEGLGGYRGAVEVGRHPEGLTVINDVGLEDYVRGISEVPARWPEAALEAQAIAARTFVLNQMGNTAATEARGAGADICASDACQVYRGVAAEERPDGRRWVAAVEETASEVLMSGDRPILAKYSSSNGGRSIAGPAKYLRPVDDPDDAKSPLHRWNYSRPLVEFGQALSIDPPSRLAALDRRGDSVVLGLRSAAPAAPEPLAAPPTTAAPEPAVASDPADQGSTEIPTLSTITPPDTAPPSPAAPPQNLTETTISTTQFVATVNKNLPAPPGLPLPLPSWQFSFETEEGNVLVSGRGHGHGIGMSQYGAYGRALRGQNASQILSTYYGGIKPSELPDELVPSSIRVALELGRADATVTNAQYFRVLDGAGNVLAPVAVGHWRVTPAADGVRVSAPTGWGEPLSITPVAIDPAEPDPGSLTLARFSISAPAILDVTFAPPGTEPGRNPLRVVDAGEVVELLPAPAAAGEYALTIRADAGPGRLAVQPVRFRATGSTVPVDDSIVSELRLGRTLLADSAPPSPTRNVALGMTVTVMAAGAALFMLAGWKPRTRETNI